MDAKEMLEWAHNYLLHKDVVLRRIETIEDAGETLLIKNKDGSQERVVALPALAAVDMASLSAPTVLVTLNTKQNFNVLTDRWKEFCQFKELRVLFINPDSQLDTKWMIKPYVHNRICDDASLKVGLKAIFETVDPVR